MDGPALPRSIRWRLQLGVWMLPSSQKEQQQQQWQDGDAQDTESEWTLTEILERNQDLIDVQRGNYDLLVQMLQEVMEQNDEQEQEHEQGREQIDPESDEEHPSTATTSSQNTKLPTPVDPLTALVKERDAQEQRLYDLDLKYRKRRARRKRGLLTTETDRGDTYSSSLTLGVIEKDLVRLPPEHHTYHHSRKNFGHQGEDVPFQTSAMERSTRLTEMLQIYAHQNPHIGYRQGMHEIASYLLLVIEMDLFDLESQQRQPDQLLDPTFIAHDTYCMFLAVMSQLGPAYDVKMNQGAESPMEQMAQSIMAKIRDTANDKNLHRHLINLNCPPELYCTRWVRLMFSREVAGWKNVLLLWDIFFDLVATCPLTSMARSRYTRPGVSPVLRLGGFSLMLVMEAASASMILLQRSALLSHQDGADADSIHRLMNISPLKNILPLTATLLSMMRRIQLQQDQLELPLSKRRPLTLSELAQNAFSTGGQSILNILNGNPVNSNTLASEEASRTPITPVSSEVKQERYSTTETVAKPSVPQSDKAAKVKAMALKLNDATHTLKRFLTELEQKSSGSSGCQVPPTVWAALEEIGGIQTEMSMHQGE